MSVTETKGALGSWSLKLKPDTPRAVIDAIAYFGHVVVSTGRPDPRVAGDTLLTSGRYTGVLTGKTFASDGSGYNLSGSGMSWWLGDSNNDGPVITTMLTFTAASFTSVVNALLPVSGSVTAGNLHSVTGAYTGYHQWQTTRKALDYVCATMTSDYTNPVEYRVNGNATLDAGYVSDLYVVNPVAAVVRRDVGGDMGIRALPGKATTTEDVQDFRTQLILLAQGQGTAIATGSATISPALNPYKDLHGNTMSIISAVSESSTDPTNANARAAVTLNTYSLPRQAIKLSTNQFDIKGDIAVGDWVWVHDPDAGLVDVTATPNEIVFRGQRINPIKLRVAEMTYPLTSGMSVAYRDYNGNWVDLTDYVIWETGDTNLTVGGYDRSLTNPTGEVIGSRPMPNTSIPNSPAFTTPFTLSVYQSPNSGITKAQVQVTWTRPTNTDGSAIIDGDHYEIQYRTSAHSIFPSTWLQASGLTWSQMDVWDQCINLGQGPWQTVYTGFDHTSILVQELTPGVPYDFQIRAVDNGTPPNYSAWSATTTVQMNGDTIAPSTPAPPTMASSRIAIQVTHMLGKSGGGTYNLEPDLHHLEIHAQYEPTFTPSDSTLLGKLIANNGMITGGIPAVGTFQVESTNALYVKCIAVDEAGNKSNPSTAVQATASLIDDAHISDLTVTKVTAGTITSDWLIGARIKTGDSGARVELNSSGLQAYNSSGTQTVTISAADGSAILTGKVQTGTTGDRVVMDPAFTAPGVGTFPSLCFYAAAAIGPGRINATGAVLGVNSPPSASGASFNQTTLLMAANFAALQFNDQSNTVAGGGVATVDNASARLEYQVANTRSGGFVWADSGDAFFGYHTASVDAFLAVDNGGTYQWRGKWNNNNFLNPTDALQTGDQFLAAGFGGYISTYGSTMASSMAPIVTITGAAPNFDWCLTSLLSTSFTVSWSDALAHTTTWFAMRM